MISQPPHPSPEIAKIYPKIHGKSQGTLEAKTILKKNIPRFFTLISKLITKLELSQ